VTTFGKPQISIAVFASAGDEPLRSNISNIGGGGWNGFETHAHPAKHTSTEMKRRQTIMGFPAGGPLVRPADIGEHRWGNPSRIAGKSQVHLNRSSCALWSGALLPP
jgi:hypothetical protein